MSKVRRGGFTRGGRRIGCGTRGRAGGSGRAPGAAAAANGHTEREYRDRSVRFPNTNAAGGALTGEVGPIVYGNAHAGVSGVYNAAGSTVG
jgi:hypothetical protein